MISTQPLHAVCRAFLTRIDESGVSVTTSDLLLVELGRGGTRDRPQGTLGEPLARRRTDGRARRRAGRHLNDTISRYETVLRSIDHIPVPIADTAGAARRLMTGYGLASYDAVHAASAVLAGAGAIATIDTAFRLMALSMTC